MELVERYIAAGKALRPRGVIWEVKPGSVTEKEIRIEAEQLAEIQQSIEDMLKETDLRKVFHFLEEWEDVFGLPHTGSYEERIAALNAADTESVISIERYVELCALQGVTVTIREHCPFMFGWSRFGGSDECGAPEIIFCWEIIIHEAVDDAAVAGMKNLVTKLKQSHTWLTFIDERTLEQ